MDLKTVKNKKIREEFTDIHLCTSKPNFSISLTWTFLLIFLLPVDGESAACY
jgi:hypothetical protein